MLKDNVYANPFWSQTAFFRTSGGHAARVAVYWKVAAGGTERAQFLGSAGSFFMPRPGEVPAMISRRDQGLTEQNRYAESNVVTEVFPVPDHYELLPEPLRHDSGHGGSHPHLTHEFVSSVLERRSPTVNIYEALAYTIPGIYAHRSSLEGGSCLTIPDYGQS